MQEHPDQAHDLNELERRLTDWRPATAGLSPDQVLFAAGRASSRAGVRQQLTWIASGCLAALTVVLGTALVHEREARLTLLAQLQESRPVIEAAPHPLPDAR